MLGASRILPKSSGRAQRSNAVITEGGPSVNILAATACGVYRRMNIEIFAATACGVAFEGGASQQSAAMRGGANRCIITATACGLAFQGMAGQWCAACGARKVHGVL